MGSETPRPLEPSSIKETLSHALSFRETEHSIAKSEAELPSVSILQMGARVEAFARFITLIEGDGIEDAIMNFDLSFVVQGAIEQAIVRLDDKSGPHFAPDYAKLLTIAAALKTLVTRPPVAQDSLHKDTQAIGTAAVRAATTPLDTTE